LSYIDRFLRKECNYVNRITILLSAILACSGPVLAQRAHDPGLRGGSPGAGGPLQGLGANELAIFNSSKVSFEELEATCEGCNDLPEGTPQDPFLAFRTNSAGLGARFNADSCFSCHSQPSSGGSGGFLVPNPQLPPSQQRPPENPSFDLIPHRKGATNQVPSFITQFGPIREARFVRNPDGTPDGGVHNLFTIAGRFDDPSIPGCTAAVLPQPDFAAELRRNNVSFRIPLQVFGLGLLDAIQDREILARHDATQSIRSTLGIQGVPNRSPNDGTIARFGWKAQNKSIQLFAGEAYNVEMGVTNDLFPQAREENPLCNGPRKPLPNDLVRSDAGDFLTVRMLPDWFQFQAFMRFLDGPKPVPFSASATRGQQLFGTGPSSPGIGCFACHTPVMTTAQVTRFQNALGNKNVNAYSDLLVHHMGGRLADRITQGVAQGDMFRTTPLWGIGQRRFFIHDGRTSDLLEAIDAHFFDPRTTSADLTDAALDAELRAFPPSEANEVIRRFRALGESDKQAILDFLRSL
jgi:CxxC motif-containing protein (DUF1111 family)